MHNPKASQRTPDHLCRRSALRGSSAASNKSLPKESHFLPKSLGDVHVRLLRQLGQLHSKSISAAPALLQDIADLRQTAEQSNRLHIQQLNRVNLELQSRGKLSNRIGRSGELLHAIADVLRQTANNSTDERFQGLYDEFILLLQKIDREESESPVPQLTWYKSVAANRQLIVELKEEQERRAKVEEHLDLIFEGTRQSLLAKEVKIRELQKTLMQSKQQVLAANTLAQQQAKISRELAEKTSALEQQLRLTMEASIANLEPTCTTLAESRVGRSMRSPPAVSSPKRSEICTEALLSPPHRVKSKLPPLPLSPSSVEERKRHTLDWQQDSILRMLLVQAYTIESCLNSTEPSR